jgi:N utilization substance protein A
MLFDLKILKQTLQQLQEEKSIPEATLIEALELALGAAYKRDYGTRGQIIKSKFDMDNGDVVFYQVKTVVDDTTVRPALTDEEREAIASGEIEPEVEPTEGEEVLPRFDEEKHMYLADAKLMKSNVHLGDEMIFPLDAPEQDFGRVAAQTAKQVIMQRIREAERGIAASEFNDKVGTIIVGTVQKVDRGTIFVDIGKSYGILPKTEQIPGEFYKTGDRIRCYLSEIDNGPKGMVLKLSRSHPRMIIELFKLESPEVAAGTVEIKSLAREAGARSKMAVMSHDDMIDPIGACVGQRGGRVTAVTDEIGGEKIDIVVWSEDPAQYVANAIAPARVLDIRIDEESHQAFVSVANDQLSLAIGKAGQNARLAARLTGWKIDIKGIEGTPAYGETQSDESIMDVDESGFTSLDQLFTGDTPTDEVPAAGTDE